MMQVRESELRKMSRKERYQVYGQLVREATAHRDQSSPFSRTLDTALCLLLLFVACICFAILIS